MSVSSIVNVLADLAAIVTAGIAVVAWFSFKHRSRDQQERLENYLEQVMKEAQANPAESGEGMRSVIHVMAHLYMTESQVYDAAFSSKKIKSWPRTGKDGVADQVMLQYNPKRRAKDGV